MVKHHPTNIPRTSNQRETVPLALRETTGKRRSRRRWGSQSEAPRGPERETDCQEPGDTPRRGAHLSPWFPTTRRANDRHGGRSLTLVLWLRHRSRHHAPVFRLLTAPKPGVRRGRYHAGLVSERRVTGDSGWKRHEGSWLASAKPTTQGARGRPCC